MKNNTCSNTPECNFNTTVAKVCFTDGICRCSSLYGFAGDDCTEVTGKLVFYRIFNAFGIILGILLIFGHTYLLFKRTNFKSIKLKETKRVWAIFALSFLCSITSLVASSLRSISYYDSTTHNLIKYKEVGIDVEIVVADTDFFTYKLWTTAFCLGILMSNVIILSWFSIVKRVSEVFPKILAQREKNLATFLNFYIPTFVLLLILSLFVNTEAFILNLLILTISNIISLVMFIWLSLYVIKPIKELLLDQNSSIGKVVKLITKTLRLIVVLGVINIIAPILGVIGLLLYPNNPTEELGTLTAFIEIFAVLVGIVNSTFGLWYSSKLISQN